MMNRLAVCATVLLVLAAIGFSQPSAAAPSGTCSITDNTSLRNCADHAATYATLAFTADVSSPATPASCGPNGTDAIIIRGLTGTVIDGQGHTWNRAAPLACSAILLQQAHDITIRNLSIVDNPGVPPCELSQKKCPYTINVDTDSNVTLDGVKVYDGKGYVVRVWHTNGFTFTNGVIANAGQIGIFVGQWKFGASQNVSVTNSVIAHSRTNGIAIQGAEGVTITGDVFNNNHWHGLWPVANVKGGITTGGQLLLADATDAKVTGNLFANAACGNCVPKGQAVLTIELGEGPAEPGVKGLVIENNTVLNSFGPAFHQNGGSNVANVQVAGNKLRGNIQLGDIKAATLASNTVTKPASPRMGQTTNEAFRIQLDGTHHTSPTATGYAGGKVEAVFGLNPPPLPGGPTTPVMNCMSGSADFPSTSTTCGGTGTPAALLGFAYPAGYPKTQPFYSCQVTGRPTDQFLSWDAHCEGQTVIAAMGNAVVLKP
jgi:hypothetical protein